MMTDEQSNIELIGEITGNFDRSHEILKSLEKRLGEKYHKFLYEHFDSCRRYAGRVIILNDILPYARTSSNALKLGKLATKDRSKHVRTEAFSILAYSLRKDLLPFLREQADTVHIENKDDLEAAILAIEEQNHNLFMDRDRSGQIFWYVNDDMDNIDIE